VKIRPNAGNVDYASKEAFEKAGLTPDEPEKEEDDPEFNDEQEGENTGDHSMHL
jgi:hypothetical protein